MIKFLEAAVSYNDTWNLTFYFVAILALLIGGFWTYIKVFVSPVKNKTALKENIIYQDSEDLIEKSYDKKSIKKNKKNTK